MTRISKTGLVKKVGNVSIMLIDPPKYYFGKKVFNEYEVRNFLAEVAEGSKPWGMKFKDERNDEWRILADGRLESINNHEACPWGWDFSSNSTIRRIKTQRFT